MMLHLCRRAVRRSGLPSTHSLSHAPTDAELLQLAALPGISMPLTNNCAITQHPNFSVNGACTSQNYLRSMRNANDISAHDFNAGAFRRQKHWRVVVQTSMYTSMEGAGGSAGGD